MKQLFSIGAMIVVGLGAGSLAAWQLDPEKHTFLMSEEEKALLFEMELLESLDLYAAHPDDLSKPAHVFGMTDEEISSLNPYEIAELIEAAEVTAYDNLNEPRYLFELGRLVFIHGDSESALNLFADAAQAGSAGAHYYLAQFASDNETALSHLDLAAAERFADAAELASQIRQEIAEEEARIAAQKAAEEAERQRRVAATSLSTFNYSSLIKAFYDNDQATLRSRKRDAIMYLNYMDTVLSDPSVYFRSSPQLEQELDPNLGWYVGQAISTDGLLINSAASAGGNMVLNMLMGMASARSSGATIGEEIAAGNRALYNSQKPFSVFRLESQQDAKKLVMLYNESPDTFRKIYSGMKEFVYNY